MPFDATYSLLDRDPATLTTARERIEYLRDFLRYRVDPNKFNMNHWATVAPNESPARSVNRVLNVCGSVACIGGWTNALFAKPELLWEEDEAQVLLGLTEVEALNLFYPGVLWSDDEGWEKITPVMAADVLDRYLQTGKIDWG